MISKAMLLAATLAVSGMAQAETVYDLPDPAVTVRLNFLYNTTSVTIDGVSYTGPSQFYYLSECALPDTFYRHCNILEEDNVVLTAADGSTVTATVIDQSLRTLIRSGHNYWRSSETVIGGTVTTP